MIKKKNTIIISLGLLIGLFSMDVYAGESDSHQVEDIREVIAEDSYKYIADVKINEENFPDPIFR